MQLHSYASLFVCAAIFVCIYVYSYRRTYREVPRVSLVPLSWCCSAVAQQRQGEKRKTNITRVMQYRGRDYLHRIVEFFFRLFFREKAWKMNNQRALASRKKDKSFLDAWVSKEKTYGRLRRIVLYCTCTEEITHFSEKCILFSYTVLGFKLYNLR